MPPVAATAAPDPIPDPDPTAQSSNFIHGLIGLSPGGFSETVRNSISSLARRDPDAAAAVKLDDDANRSSSNSSSNSEGHPPPPPAAPEPRPRQLLALPPEILLLVLLQLDFGDIFRLRRTCKHLHNLASPAQIRALFGATRLHTQLVSHCKTCLRYDHYRSRLLQPVLSDPGYPLASCCLDCALEARDPRIRVGRKINMANYDTVWVCRWCGYPITEGAAFGCDQMHRFCYKRYNDVLFVSFVVGWVQLFLGIVAAALAWRYYRDVVLVFAPTVTNFILLWICLVFLILRGNRRRTYHWTLVLELAILCLWIPPVYHIATSVAASPGTPVPTSTRATLALFALNMLFRLLNFLGNIMLVFRFDTTERYRTRVPKWARSLHYLLTGLVMWTYPQSLEQKMPPESPPPESV